MLWVKAFHVIFMVTWFAGLFYLPRLFIYHTEAGADDTTGIARFKIMERRLLAITHIGGGLTAIFGLWLLFNWRGDLLQTGWFQLKAVLVAGLIGYHVICAHYVRVFRDDANQRSSRYYRIFNELPALALISIILLAILKPF